MFGCCGVSESSLAAMIDACYPRDGTDIPLSARLRDLVNFAVQDFDRLSSIDDIFLRIMLDDIKRGNYGRVSVGLKIIIRMHQSLREINMNLSLTLTSVIISLIESADKKFIDLATDSIKPLMASSQGQTLSASASSIADAYLRVITRKIFTEECLRGITTLSESSMIDWLPIEEILFVVKENFDATLKLNDVVSAMANSLIPISIPGFAQKFFNFINIHKIWSEGNFLITLLIQIFSEMNDTSSQILFHSWLELLPPLHFDCSHCNQIISMSIQLFHNIQPMKLVSQVGISSFSVLLQFIMSIPSLPMANQQTLLRQSLELESLIISNYQETSIQTQANELIWRLIPSGKEQAKNYEETKVLHILKAAKTFAESSSINMTSSMISQSCSSLLPFVVSFKHSESILSAILKYFYCLYPIESEIRVKIVSLFLVSLQDEIQKKRPLYDFQLHSFILCAFYDQVPFGPLNFGKYVEKVVHYRIYAKPIQIDTSMNFVRHRFFEIVSKISAKCDVSFLFEGSKISGFMEKIKCDSDSKCISESRSIDQIRIPRTGSKFCLVYGNPDLDDESSSSGLPTDFEDAVESVKSTAEKSEKAMASSIQFDWERMNALEFSVCK